MPGTASKLLSRARQQAVVRATLAVALLISGCGESGPPLPDEIPLEGAPEPVQKAIREAYAAAQEKPIDADALLALATVLHAHNSYGPALAAYDRTLWLQRSFPAVYGRALVLDTLGRKDEAISAFAESTHLRPDYRPARLRLAERRLDANLLTGAMQEYRIILDTDPWYARAHYGLGRIFQTEKKIDEAAREFDLAVQSCPAYGAAHYELAQILIRQGLSERAKEHLDKHRKYALVQPPFKDEVEEEIRRKNAGPGLLVRDAIASVERGNIENAVSQLQQALKLDPNNVDANMNMLVLMTSQGRNLEAETYFRKAIQLTPNRPDAYYNFGILRFGEKRYPDACEAFKMAMEIEPQYAEALTYYGFCEENYGHPDEAERLFRKAVEAKPSYRTAAAHLARRLALRKELSQAIRLLESIQSPVDKETPQYALALGMAYAQSKQSDKAKLSIERAMELGRSLNQPQVVAQARSMLAGVR